MMQNKRFVPDARDSDIAAMMERPKNYHKLPERERWAIDKKIGILDMTVKVSKDQRLKLNKYFD